MLYFCFSYWTNTFHAFICAVDIYLVNYCQLNCWHLLRCNLWPCAHRSYLLSMSAGTAFYFESYKKMSIAITETISYSVTRLALSKRLV